MALFASVHYPQAFGYIHIFLILGDQTEIFDEKQLEFGELCSDRRQVNF